MRPGGFNWPERHKNTRSSLRFCTANQGLQTPVNRRLRRNRPALEPQLTQRQRGMSKPQLRRLPKPRGELVEPLVSFEQAQRLEPEVGPPAPAAGMWLV